jgi:hypothetical protein
VPRFPRDSLGEPHWTIFDPGSSKKLRKPAFFRQIRQGFANRAGGSIGHEKTMSWLWERGARLDK